VGNAQPTNKNYWRIKMANIKKLWNFLGDDRLALVLCGSVITIAFVYMVDGRLILAFIGFILSAWQLPKSWRGVKKNDPS
jgi:hypothetical protein